MLRGLRKPVENGLLRAAACPQKFVFKEHCGLFTLFFSNWISKPFGRTFIYRSPQASPPPNATNLCSIPALQAPHEMTTLSSLHLPRFSAPRRLALRARGPRSPPQALISASFTMSQSCLLSTVIYDNLTCSGQLPTLNKMYINWWYMSTNKDRRTGVSSQPTLSNKVSR